MKDTFKKITKSRVFDDENIDKQIQEIAENINHNAQLSEERQTIKTQRIGKTSKANVFHIGTDSTGAPELAIKINGVNYKITLTAI